MTLIIIFGTVTLISIALAIWAFCQFDWEWLPVLGTIVGVLAGIALIASLIQWIPSQKNSEILYTQLLAEKRTIEAMLETERDADRLLLSPAVINYNNQVIWQKMSYDRPIYRDYFNKNCDWAELELIEWK